MTAAVTASDYADLVGPIALAIIALVFAVVLFFCAAFAAHEWKWTRRERLIRVGGPADRTRTDRLAQYSIEPDHPEEKITTTNPKENHDHHDNQRATNPRVHLDP